MGRGHPSWGVCTCCSANPFQKLLLLPPSPTPLRPISTYTTQRLAAACAVLSKAVSKLGHQQAMSCHRLADALCFKEAARTLLTRLAYQANTEMQGLSRFAAAIVMTFGLLSPFVTCLGTLSTTTQRKRRNAVGRYRVIQRKFLQEMPAGQTMLLPLSSRTPCKHVPNCHSSCHAPSLSCCLLQANAVCALARDAYRADPADLHMAGATVVVREVCAAACYRLMPLALWPGMRTGLTRPALRSRRAGRAGWGS